jgi:hypothetical protein
MSDQPYDPVQPTNIESSGTNTTTKYFNNYFAGSTEISQNINDSILSYFEEQTGNIESARLLVVAVIETAKAQREDPIAVLNQFQKMPAGELNAFIALYLNTSRVNTSFLGIKSTPKSNQYVTRTIIA